MSFEFEESLKCPTGLKLNIMMINLTFISLFLLY